MTTETPTKEAEQATAQQPKSRPFPNINGGCVCYTVRYRLLTSPLFCYACHCPDCQKLTGSGFGLFLHMEAYNVQVLSPTQPVLIAQQRGQGHVSRLAVCPSCKVELWSESFLGKGVVDVRVGTLSFASLFEPDVHTFTESKLSWLILPEGARTRERDYNYKELWPKSSLRRLDICLKRVEAAAKARETLAQAHVPGSVQVTRPDRAQKEEVIADGEKTPTAPEMGSEAEDDDAFEKRVKETEKRLQERLEKLSAKLDEGDGEGRQNLESVMAKLSTGVDEGEESKEGTEVKVNRESKESKAEKGEGGGGKVEEKKE